MHAICSERESCTFRESDSSALSCVHFSSHPFHFPSSSSSSSTLSLPFSSQQSNDVCTQESRRRPRTDRFLPHSNVFVRLSFTRPPLCLPFVFRRYPAIAKWNENVEGSPSMTHQPLILIIKDQINNPAICCTSKGCRIILCVG